MNILEAIILGIIQGLSEFLPISSSGHLLVFHEVFGITASDNLTFIIVLNMGSLVPLLYVFRKDILELLKRPFQKLTLLLVIATIPLVAVTLLFEQHIEALFFTVQFLPFAFLITGVALFVSDRLNKNKKEMKDITVVDAAIVGLAQAVAVVPGISRSGSTITATMARGVKREQAAKFSFLMSIPAAIGAMVFRLTRIIGDPLLLEGLNVPNLIAGFIAAAVSGYFAINFMLKLVKTAKLKYFAVYYIVAIVLLIIVLF
ncbi:MAG: undecaprenyl-diphosphate phosphatase [Defluviitaleaceae bacterium]|nr:undecaprenyl-diphosphate phosphatase [Defluviitaleaceae bacterium]